MVHKVTNDVNIVVETFYQPAQSKPIHSEYLFAYRITIENLGSVPVKLMRRHWHIIDSNGDVREVEGEGVVGQQPTIAPGESYQYISSCNLSSDMGKMYGTYMMEDLFTKKMMQVGIPEFMLIAPFKNN
ncbi:MAG TPA: Co2+/Mg2+ efflux protein ApaG [Chitinophagaceae bacterium]|nr:Co2+/Mg2+ efflux protein ApaG [Chitinophagaceae bacterium]